MELLAFLGLLLALWLAAKDEERTKEKNEKRN